LVSQLSEAVRALLVEGDLSMRRIANHSIEFVLAVILLASGAAPQVHAVQRCMNGTLRGDFGGLLKGTVIGLGPLATVAKVNFDGAGGWSYTESGNLNGNPIPAVQFTGTYKVAPDCTGSTKDSGGNSTDFVIVGSGKDIEVMMAGTAPGAVFTIVLKKLFGSSDE
jgi:hypothetical protein